MASTTPYGYLKDKDDPNVWIVDEEAAVVVRRIFHMTMDGYGPYQIAKALKEYADWKLSQPSVTEPDEVEEEYKKVIATLPQKQEEAITKYCDQIFNSGAETEEFFYRLGLRDGMKLRKNVKMVLKQLSE